MAYWYGLAPMSQRAGHGRPFRQPGDRLWYLALLAALAGFIGLVLVGRGRHPPEQPAAAPGATGTGPSVFYLPLLRSAASPSATPSASPSPTATSTTAPVNGTYYVDGQAGDDGNPGTQALPWRTVGRAINSVPRGSTVIIASGIYRAPTLTFGPAGLSDGHLTTFKAAPGARVIFSTADDTPPSVYISDYVRLEGLWFGGRYENANEQIWGGFRVGGGPIGVGRQIVGCTLFGYREGIQIGSSEHLLVQGNRVVWSGHGELMHGIYLSGGYTSGAMSQHIIVDDNLFVSGEGWGIHGWHDIRSSIVTRNFVTQHNYGSVMDGSDHLVANNFFWRQHGGLYSPKGFWLAGSQIAFYNNILGPDSRISGDSRLTPNTLLNNAFLGPNSNSPPLGTGGVALTTGQEAAQLGLPAAELDDTIQSLEQAFSESIAAIYANDEIEGWFETLKLIVPESSPLYQAGAPWFGQPVNIGPDAPAPATPAGFWAAFRGLGLRDWDRYGNVNP